MNSKKDLTIQELVFLILTLSYLLYSYYAQVLSAVYSSNHNVFLGLNVLKLVLGASLSIAVFYNYKSTFGTQWKKFRYHSWLKFLWLILGWIGTVLIINLVKLLLHWITGNPLSGYWNNHSLLFPPGLDASWHTLNVILVYTNFMVFAFAQEVVFRHILFLKHWGDKAATIAFGLMGLVLFGVLFYDVNEPLVNTLPYALSGLILILMHLLSRNIWYAVFTSILFYTIAIILSLSHSFMLPYLS